MIMRYEVDAFNTATASSNKIHDDVVAREFGFRGGLVPGVDVYAYMTHLPAEQWGLEWLGSGTMSARFVQPVYEGERVTVHGEVVDGEMTLSVTGPDGTFRATGRAAPTAVPAPDRPLPLRAPRPEVRPAASADSLRPGTVLGSLAGRFDPGGSSGYLAGVGEVLTLYTEKSVAHPGWVLRFANTVLAESVELGPWIHVSSDVVLLGLVEAGDELDVRAQVTSEYERRGHRFVELDVAVLAGDRPIQRIAHTAIYSPRRLVASDR